MITRRDVIVTALTLLLTLAAVGLASSMKQVIGTTVIPWETLEAESARGGQVHTYINAATSTLLDLTVQARTLESGATPHPVRPHSRPLEEILIVKAGSLKVAFEERIHRLGPGGLVFLAPNQWHELHGVGDQPVTYYRLQWRSPGMDGKRQEIGL